MPSPSRSRSLRMLFGLLALACTEAVAPAESPPAPPVLPVLRFVGTCARPAVWWLQVDGSNLPPTGIWLLNATDSLDFPARPGASQLLWVELDGNGFALQSGWAPVDTAGAARAAATCSAPAPR